MSRRCGPTSLLPSAGAKSLIRSPVLVVSAAPGLGAVQAVAVLALSALSLSDALLLAGAVVEASV